MATDVSELVRRAASGHRGSWDALVDQFGSMIWAIARSHRLGASDVADVVQTTWLKFVEHIDRIQSPERVGGWLATTARRECLRLQQRSTRHVLTDDESDFDVHAAPPPAPDARLICDERDAALWEAFDELPARSRVLLSLLSVEPAISYKEISEILDMPIGSIGPTRARMLAQLRKGVEERSVFVDSLAV
jgi:RNA polymerase sigma factor (sigma-70 family)